MSSEIMEEGFYLQDLLDTGEEVLMLVSVPHYGIELPPHLRNRLFCHLRLKEDQVPDLILDDDGISGTFTFNTSSYYCWIPWEAVEGYAGDAIEAYLSRKPKLQVIDGGSKISNPSTQNSKVPKLRVIK